MLKLRTILIVVCVFNTVFNTLSSSLLSLLLLSGFIIGSGSHVSEAFRQPTFGFAVESSFAAGAFDGVWNTVFPSVVAGGAFHGHRLSISLLMRHFWVWRLGQFCSWHSVIWKSSAWRFPVVSPVMLTCFCVAWHQQEAWSVLAMEQSSRTVFCLVRGAFLDCSNRALKLVHFNRVCLVAFSSHAGS